MTQQMERYEGEASQYVVIEKDQLKILLDEVIDARQQVRWRFTRRLFAALATTGVLGVSLINYATDRTEEAAMRVERQAAVDSHAVLCLAINSGVVGLESVTFGPMREQLGGELSTLNGGIGVIAEEFAGSTTTTLQVEQSVEFDPLSNPLVDESMSPETLVAAREEISKPCPPPLATVVSNGG